ncbi:MAG TPA: pilus assembly protein TadG-related protein [Rhizomicrobium sp.]|jgi:Flp pilus assembly protein TadG
MLIRFIRDRRGNFSILSAVMLTSLVGVGGLAVDYGNGLYNRLKDQRVADIAAAAGARVYDETESNSAVATAVTNVGALNGVSGTAISDTIVNSPTGDGNRAVKVTVTSQAPLTFARLLQPGKTSIAVQAVSLAEMKPGGSGCVIALSSSGTGVTATGGTRLTATSCAVASNQTITCTGGGSITTNTIYYYTAAPSCSNLQNANGQTPAELQAYTADPLAGSPEVLAQTGRLSAVESLSSPSNPSNFSGTSLAFAKSGSGAITNALSAQGCSGSYSASVWTVTCPAGANVTFGTISASGTVTVNFNVSGSSSNTYNFTQVATDAGTLNFGPGTYNVSQGILTTNGSAVTTFGAGNFNIGAPPSSTACNGSYSYSICNSGPTMTFAGPSKFVLTGGVYAHGNSTVTLGSSGSSNSFDIGKAHDGNSVYMGGSSIVWFGDATGSGDLFEMAGSFNVPQGGTCIRIGAATYHDINGFFLTAGGSILGAGTYTVANYVSLGGSNGGNVTCWGTSTGMNAPDTTFVIGGNSLDSSGHAFYIGAGYSSVNITAPISGNTQGLAVIGPTSSTNVGTAVLTEGASNTIVSGAFYFPYGAVSLSGSAALGDSSGQCLEVIGKQVTLSGGSALASSCNIPGVGTTGTSGLVSLVQ